MAAARERFTISARVSERLMQSAGLASTPLYHPPPLAPLCYSRPAEPYVFFPSRIEHAKRQELLLRAMQAVRAPVVALFAGEGGQSEAMRQLAAKSGLHDRVRFLGHVTSEELAGYYAHAMAVFFGPRDEDYGYVTLEAMLCAKPVITCADSGGPLEFVVDGETGLVVAPEPQAVAAAIDELAAKPARARAFGQEGLARYGRMVPPWDKVAATLLGAA
jgi:glycosyltransferase involved in cell wall biosynthesis